MRHAYRTSQTWKTTWQLAGFAAFCVAIAAIADSAGWVFAIGCAVLFGLIFLGLALSNASDDSKGRIDMINDPLAEAEAQQLNYRLGDVINGSAIKGFRFSLDDDETRIVVAIVKVGSFYTVQRLTQNGELTA